MIDMKLLNRKKRQSGVEKLSSNARQSLRAKYLLSHGDDDDYSSKWPVVGAFVIIAMILLGFHLWHNADPNGAVPSTTHEAYEDIITYPRGIKQNMHKIQKKKQEEAQDKQSPKARKKANESLW